MPFCISCYNSIKPLLSLSKLFSLSVLLRSWRLTRWQPEAHWSVLYASESFSSKFTNCLQPWRFVCSPSHSLRINMGRARGAECPIFILWKAILCRRDLGGFDSFGDSPGTQKSNAKNLFCLCMKNGTQASKQVHKYVPRTWSNVTHLCRLRGLNTTNISLAQENSGVGSLSLFEFCPCLSVFFFLWLSLEPVMQSMPIHRCSVVKGS